MNLREFREALGLLLEDAAREIGISDGTLSKIERRIQDPTGATLRKLERWIGRKRRGAAGRGLPRVDWAYLESDG